MLSVRLKGLAGAIVCTLVVLGTLLPARADDLGKRITISVAPVYAFSTGGDDNAPPAPGTVGAGYTTDHPQADYLNVDYGISFNLAKGTDLSFTHGNIAYQLGRITSIPGTSLISGAIYDYTDTIALSHAFGGGFAMHATYFNHQRIDVTGLCLNQKYCNDPVTGRQISDPASIDEHGYTLGGSLDFGPTSKIGKIFTANIDGKYVPRPSTPNFPGVALGGLGSYVGSQFLVPYSLTAKLPITDSSTFIPFVNYTNLPVLYRDSAVPEAYRGIVFGFVKVINKNATLSYTNLNLQTCKCISRVPGPDNLRLSLGILKLDLHTGL